MILTYPEDSLQSMIEPDEWWVVDEEKTYQPGRLVWTFAPQIEQNPYTLIGRGRKEPTVHNEAIVEICPLNIRHIIRYPQLPVAALPQKKGEVFTVYRAKKRPAIIVSYSGPVVDKKLRMGKPSRQYAPTVLIAPFYGGDEGGKRAGFAPAFIERVRRCEYPQFLWDRLPLGGSTNDSVLRFDHIQPAGRSQDSLEITQFRLSNEAMYFINDWFDWIFKNKIGPLLGDYREELSKLPYRCQPQR